MAKKKEPPKPESKAQPAKTASAKTASAKKPPAKKPPAAEKATAVAKKAGAVKKVAATKKAPSPASARKEPNSDSVIIVNGIAELVRLGLGAMDPEQRATLLVALAKVGTSLAKNRG